MPGKLPQAALTIYRVKCTHAYDIRDTGLRYSLTRWPGNNVWYQGLDDGGAPYALPYGFRVDATHGAPVILDATGALCPLTTYGGCPAILTRDDRTLILQEL
jgi:hypothetical protein